MRVSFFVNNYAPSRGGVQEHIGRVAEGLVARHGMEVDVLTSDALLSPGGREPGWIDSAEETVRGVEVHRRPVARRFHSVLRMVRRLGRRAGLNRHRGVTLLSSGPLGCRYAIAALQLSRRSDVVVGVTGPTASLWYASHLASGTPTVAMPLLHLDKQVRPWVVRAVKSADRVATNTSLERRTLCELGVDPGKVTVLSPGCDLSERIEPDVARRHLGLDRLPTVGFIGRLAAHKGVDVLIEAMRVVWRELPDVSLLIAGPEAGVDVGRLLSPLSDADRSRVRVWGEYTDGEKPTLFAACDLVVHPSRSESFGMVMLEAWSASRPVVVADIPVTRELVHNGVDGVLVPLDDSRALAESVVALMRSPQDRERIGAAGRARAEAEFTWPSIVDGWAELLRSTVNESDTVWCS